MATQEQRIADAFYRAATEDKAFRALVGALSNLQTTDKSSIVAAINEARTTGGSGTPPTASESVAGVVELATVTEATTGADAVRAVTPAGVAAVRAALKAEILGGAGAAFDTLNELKALMDASDAADDTEIANILTALGNRVRADAAQSFTVPQQAQARANIGALSTVEIGNPDTDFVAVFESGLV